MHIIIWNMHLKYEAVSTKELTPVNLTALSNSMIGCSNQLYNRLLKINLAILWQFYRQHIFLFKCILHTGNTQPMNVFPFCFEFYMLST
jgi:hypothetical protein